MASAAEYELIYHAGIPGRGEVQYSLTIFESTRAEPDSNIQFIRLFFEATATPYNDSALTVGQSAIKPYMDGSFEGNGELNIQLS